MSSSGLDNAKGATKLAERQEKKVNMIEAKAKVKVKAKVKAKVNAAQLITHNLQLGASI